MHASPRVPPRFLPTLTEIVQVPSAPAQAGTGATAQSEVAAEPVRGLDPLIEQQVRELVRILVAEQIDSLKAAWRQENGGSDDK